MPMNLVPQRIIDKNGHEKTVWVSTGKPAVNTISRASSVTIKPSVEAIRVTTEDVVKWTQRNNLPLSGHEDFMDLVNARIAMSGKYTDKDFHNAYHSAFADNFGGYTVDGLRRALSATSDSASMKSDNQNEQSPSERPKFIESFRLTDPNELPEAVAYDGILYHLTGGNITSDEFYSMRVHFNRELTPEEKEKLFHILAYTWKSTVAGESLDNPENDTTFSMVVPADITKSRRSQPYEAVEDFEAKYEDYIQNGTPLRKDSTRQVEGLGGDIKVRFYYDNVMRIGSSF